MTNLICIRHERLHESFQPLRPNSYSPGAARHIRPDSCISRSPVACRLRGFDGRRNTPGKVEFDFQSRFVGNTLGQPHEPQFWKCDGGIEQPPDLDSDQHWHGGGHNHSGHRHRRGIQRRGRHVIGFHRRRAESCLPDRICSVGRRKCLRKRLHLQRRDGSYSGNLAQRSGYVGACHYHPTGEPERDRRTKRHVFRRSEGIRNPYVSMEERWKGNQRRNGSVLCGSGSDDIGKWRAIYGRRNRWPRKCDQQSRDSDRDFVPRSAIDHDAAHQQIDHGRTTCDIQRHSDRHGASGLSMEAERRQHQRCKLGFVHDFRHDRFG